MSENTHASGAVTAEAQRQQIIATANGLIGSHYLLGAGGDAPMSPINGVPYVEQRGKQNFNRGTSTEMVPPSKDISNLAIRAADCSASWNRYVCTGRYYQIAQQNGQTPGEIDPANPNSPGYQDLKKYLDSLGADPNSWAGNSQGLYPRKVVGPGVTRIDNTTSIVGKIVWGEDCTGKQHFDCVYFCMYCYWKVVPQHSWWMGIRQWANNNAMLETIPLNASLWPADILIKCAMPTTDSDKDYHHIGMYDGNQHVVQAEMACTGVVSRSYNQSEWSLCRRVKPQWLS